MADHSKIEWTDATWNPITGCSLVSEGCRRCYAATLAATRLKNHWSRAGLARLNAAGEAKFTGEVRFNEPWLDQPLRWSRPRMIFVCAHADLFHENVPDEWIDRVFAVMALCQRHTFQVLTKRPERMRMYVTTTPRFRWMNAALSLGRAGAMVGRRPSPLPNVWLGVSCEDQATANERIPHLISTPAAVRFVSCEPLLGPVDLKRSLDPLGRWDRTARDLISQGMFNSDQVDAMRRPILDWVIVGGESGNGARPMHPDWARSLRDQCQAAGVAFHFKQHGEWLHEAQQYPCPELGGQPIRADEHFVVPEDERGTHSWPDESTSFRVGKKKAGRLLDGRLWDETPQLQSS